MKNESVMKKWQIICIIILGVIVLFVPIGIYYLFFRDCAISNNPNDWGVFGDYLGGIYGGVYSVVVTILAIYLGRALAKKDSRKEKQKQAAETLLRQIKTIESNNYNLHSIKKLKKEINLNELYISDLLDDLIALSDQFQMQKDGTGIVDMEMKDNLMSQLKELYEQ